MNSGPLKEQAVVEDKHDRWFETSHLRTNLKSRSVKGGFSTIGAQVVSFVMNISSTIIMARLLAPQDFGLVAMVTAVTGFVSIFKDLGLSQAVIQREHLDQKQVSSLFWINVLISLGIALIVTLLAPVLVNFYSEDRLFLITMAFSGSILISGLSLQHNALMKRQMEFQKLSLIQIGSTAASLLTGVYMAWAGYGYWAIVATMVLPPFFTSLALWFVCNWRPNLSFNTDKVGSYLKFGASITGFDMINYFSRNMDNVLIGKFVGSAALGLYTKAYQLLLLPITQLRNPLFSVALPALSTLQNDVEKYKAFYKRFLFTLAFFSMPLVAYMAVFSDELVLIVLGDQWIKASSIFQILAITAFIQPVLGTTGLVLISTGRVKRYFTWGVINAVAVVTAFVIGVQWGVEGVAIAYAIVNYILVLPTLYFSLYKSPIPVPLFFKEIAFPALFTILSGLAMYTFRNYLAHFPDVILCVSGFLVGALLYSCLWFTSKPSRNRAKQVLEIGAVLTDKIKRR
jgi:PST family polysaccharide transporter